jgi:hypothetical protein
VVTKSRNLSLDTARGTRVGHGKILIGNLEGKRLLEKPRGRWEDNIKMDLKINMNMVLCLRTEQ